MPDSHDAMIAFDASGQIPEDAPAYARRLADAVRRATPELFDIDSGLTGRRPAPGKWSPREIVGHLIDSASNNHQRFVRTRDRDDLVVEGYDQDTWVTAQRYQDAPWADLVLLWTTYNRHLARLMAATPAPDRDRTRRVHNLHLRAYRAVAEDQPVTLGYFMNDYVDHLEHHLQQIARIVAPSPG